MPFVLTQRSLVVPDGGQTAIRVDAQVVWLPPKPDSERIPADFGAAMRLTFRTSPAGPVLARLSAEYGGCGIVSVGIRGHDQPALSDYTRSGQPLQQRVLAIAGIRWSYALGAPPT